MRIEGRQWRTLVGTARLGADTYRVIRAERAPAHAVLHDVLVGQELSVDKAATVELAIAWWTGRSLTAKPRLAAAARERGGLRYRVGSQGAGS